MSIGENNDPGKVSIRHWAPDDQPREKLLSLGPTSLSDAELLAILIRSGSAKENAVDLAKRIMRENGNDLQRLGRLGVNDLTRYKGMGTAKAISIVAALELGRRRRSVEPRERPLVSSSAIGYELIRSFLADLPHEEFWLVLLDRGNRLIETCRVSQGGMHGTVADPKIIFKKAIDRQASSVIFCHNHPSGQLRPSEEDIRLTRKLTEGGLFLDIAVHDHLIVTAEGYFSFADNGML